MNIFFQLEEENDVAQLLSLEIIGGKKIISFARRKLNIFKEKISPSVMNRIQNFPKNETMLFARDLLIQYLKDDDSKISYYLNLLEKIILQHSSYSISFFHKILEFINQNSTKNLDFMCSLQKEKIIPFQNYDPTILRHLVKYVNKEQEKAHIFFCWTPTLIKILSELQFASVLMINGKIEKTSLFQVNQIFVEISEFLSS